MIRALFVLAVLSLLPSCSGCQGGRTEPAYSPVTGGDAHRGETVIREQGCGACHQIPGIREARGVVAPPLTRFSQRTFIAGEVPNKPENLVRWIMDPHAIEPGTAMPKLGLDRQQAEDVAAFLYTLK